MKFSQKFGYKNKKIVTYIGRGRKKNCLISYLTRNFGQEISTIFFFPVYYLTLLFPQRPAVLIHKQNFMNNTDLFG